MNYLYAWDAIMAVKDSELYKYLFVDTVCLCQKWKRPDKCN